MSDKKQDKLGNILNKKHQESAAHSSAAVGAAATPYLGGEPGDKVAGSNVNTNVQNDENTNVQKPDRVRYGFDLRPPIHKALKTLAVKEDKKLYELAEEALIKLLEERGVDIRAKLKSGE